MKREEIKNTFNNAKEQFDFLKEEIQRQIVNTKYSKCEYFEIIPFSYQRNGFKKGKIIDTISSVKSTKDLYEYGFDKENRIILIKEGISIENQFYYQFLFYESDLIKSYLFDNVKSLRSVQFYFLNTNFEITSMISQSKYGAKEEFYVYENNKIKEIKVEPYEVRRQEPIPYKETFDYNEVGELMRITKNFESGYSEVIYEI